MVKATPVIGKFVIENLTTGMYDDPRSIYREYVQNSADAIDKAEILGLVKRQDAAIDISINSTSRTVTFEDNGTGIPETRVASLLQDIAQSEKEIGKEKGFRGIGRLGGLAYCDTLIFETSYAGENTKSRMIWDAKKLREIVANRTKKEDAADVIRNVTEFSSEIEAPDKHYFRVTLQNVTNSVLLSENDIRAYLSLVAPVRFDGPFIFRKLIYEEAHAHNIRIDEYEVSVNGDPIYKAYTTQLYDELNGSRTKIGEIIDVRFFTDVNRQGETIFWGWHSISNIQNVRLKKINKARGLRLRKDNIQIGDENRLKALFRDDRFNFYVVGEVYATDSRLIPNGRRDDFEDSLEYSFFKEKLKRVCNEIQSVSYDTSKISSAKRALDDLQEFTKTVKAKKREGVINNEEIVALESEFTKKKERAIRAEKELAKFQDKVATDGNSMLTKVFSGVVTGNTKPVSEIEIDLPTDNKPVYRTDKLTCLTKAERKLISKVFGVIKSVLSDDLAENLIHKIEEELK